MLSFLVLLIWIGIIFSFSLHSGGSSHYQSVEVKAAVSRVIQQDGMRVDRRLYRLYQPFMIKEGKVNGEVFIRKTAHLIEYFVLGAICALILWLNTWIQPAVRRLLLLFGPMVALIDEFVIQKFMVVNRTSSWKDVLLDSIGFYLALSVIGALRWAARSIRLKRR